MDTIEISSIMFRVCKNYLGTFPSDKLPEGVDGAHSFIANIDSSNQPGTHWISIAVDESGCANYFDSYGLPPMIKLPYKINKQNQKQRNFCCRAKIWKKDYLSYLKISVGIIIGPIDRTTLPNISQKMGIPF